MDGKANFDTCKHRSIEPESHFIRREDCDCVKLKTAYKCLLKGIFPLGIKHCYNCELYNTKIIDNITKI